MTAPAAGRAGCRAGRSEVLAHAPAHELAAADTDTMTAKARALTDALRTQLNAQDPPGPA
ncbi:hypothetical protein ACFWTC_38600 [Streptomyces sp. NPDC058619]|uniref:hypothetical protein n=1 Tax=unclassified Streptomyces TaxID=2593676 RepID=UPI003655FE8A